jgi:GT2 family glycosyltransferase/glycosyltransferase involved in cell wall biosynthesis
MVTRLLNMMGAYFGPEGVSLGANDENPKGFWERRDVLDLDEALLQAAGADWFRVTDFALANIPPSTLASFRQEAAKLILVMDAHRPWVMKEPRQCLLFPLWRELLEVPVCIFVHRPPIQIAQSLQRRNGFPIPFGLALWERYTLDALKAMAGLPVIVVLHEDLMRDPIVLARRLFKDLRAVGVRGLRQPSTQEILAFIEPKYFRHQGDEALQLQFMNHRQQQLDLHIRNDLKVLLSPGADLTISVGGQAQLSAYEHYLTQGQALQGVEQALAESTALLNDREHALAKLSRRLGQVEQEFLTQGQALQGVELALAESAALLNERDQSLAMLSARLHQVEQEFLTQGQALQKAEQRNNDLSMQVETQQARIIQAEEHLDRYHNLISQSVRDLEAIQASARWRLGNRLVRFLEVLLLRGRPPLVLDELLERCEQTRAWGEAFNKANRPISSLEQAELDSLREWLSLLDADYQALLRSIRWRLGNALVRPIEIGLGRGKPRLAMDLLRDLFGQIRDWTPTGNTDQDISQCEIWFAQINKLLENLLASKRWQVGHQLISLVERLLRRPKPQLVVHHMREVLDYYATWREPHPPVGDEDEALARFDFLALAPPPQSTWVQQVDVIIPVYNALPDVKRCLTALHQHDDGTIAQIIVVNDGSDQETTDWLRAFQDSHDQARLIEQPTNQGYTHAINTGMAASTAPYLLLLNSDTIVTRGWLRGLLSCLSSDPRAGIVGPLSNAATWQSVPELYDDRQHFAHNSLPPGLSPDDMALVVAHAATPSYPQTPFVNGFCFLLKRDLMTSIGHMDEEHFPQGYGEENDYCIRAAKAGFTLRIADDVYVYHAQSKSFGHERRETLSAAGFEALERKHGLQTFHGLVDQVKDTSNLDRIRLRIRHSLQSYQRWQALRIQALQSVYTQPYLPRHLAPPSVPSADIPLHILIYSDQPGPDLRLTLEGLASGPLPPTRYLHLLADWSPVEQRFRHQSAFPGRIHRFDDERGFYAAVKSVMDDIGAAHFCVIRQGIIAPPTVIDALLETCVSPGGYAAASPITNRLTGLAVPLAKGGNPLSTNAKVALSHGEALGVAAPMLDLDIFLVSKQALATVPFPGFVNDKTDQSLIRFFVALASQGLTLGILLSRYAFRVASGPFARPRVSESIAALAEPVDREPLLARLTAFRQHLAPWHLALQQSQPIITAPETVCVVMSTLHLYGGVIVLVNWINQLILSGVDVRVFVLHYDGAPATGLRLLFEPRPLTDTASAANELPRATRIVATLWSTVAVVEDLVSRVPAARGYYFIQDYETLFYHDNPAERAERHAAEASYGTPLRKVVTSRWIAAQLPTAADSGPESLTRIPVGIDHAIFPPSERQPRDADHPLVIVAMARPETPRRGFDLLIAALRLVKTHQPGTEIHLFGSPALSQYAIPFSFVDLGTVATDLLRHVYADADIFVDSSDFQGFGLCPLEAMAMGCGCVLTDSGGILEYAKHGVNALIVPHDVHALAASVETLIKDPTLRQRLGAAAVETAQAFDYSRTTYAWRRLFNQE